MQGSQQDSTGEDEGGCRPQAPRPAGRLPAEQILCRQDRQPAHHRGTVPGVKLPPLHQRHRLQEGHRQCRQRHNVEATETQWSPEVTVGGEPIMEVGSFVYLRSVEDQQGGTDRDVIARIGKARAAFVMFRNIWTSGGISMRTKLSIFNSNVKSILLYGHRGQHRRRNKRFRNSSTPV